jgi:type VI secretion system secreted protein VgrG
LSEVWLHAEKDQRIEVENDESHWVGHDRTKTIDHDETSHIKHNRTETVDNDEIITIHNNRTERVDHNETISIGKNRSETAGKTLTEENLRQVSEEGTQPQRHQAELILRLYHTGTI